MSTLNAAVLRQYIPLLTVHSVSLWHRAITRDPELYPDPESFIPERYLGSNTGVLDPATYVFGFGRRLVDYIR